MSQGKKSEVRQRMQRTGESYGDALRAIRSREVGAITQQIQQRLGINAREPNLCAMCGCGDFKASEEFDGRCECTHAEEDHG